eukprot:CAMPEP_0202085524 /NCGR_PEP_ID=MMETSP0964-20121228/31045_1 /ASSEMBLY_ACC=CAM_ASM_000500 /TAXON_ID=4773 /ORGANISM="Schizochytrium aggregatum, Strain ATCC28209" /LENGTH=135 /DNA_ID=CAMNT_0048653359 /DNA_START=27 /DNA_END=434 /DNA_ORIENTATION=-
MIWLARSGDLSVFRRNVASRHRALCLYLCLFSLAWFAGVMVLAVSELLLPLKSVGGIRGGSCPEHDSAVYGLMRASFVEQLFWTNIVVSRPLTLAVLLLCRMWVRLVETAAMVSNISSCVRARFTLQQVASLQSA